MTDQGWMVDDGTCDECLIGECWDCAKPCDGWDDEGRYQYCCCNEGYHLGHVDVEAG